MTEKILVISAHPDDETLGLGGTILLKANQGDQVYVLIFSDGELAREKIVSSVKQRENQAKKAAKILKIKEIKFLGYHDQKLDTIPLIELARHIEKAIKEWKPTTIYTHFWGDVNQDHQVLFNATSIATRPTPKSKIKKVICYETPSSTEWSHHNFKPNLFVNINKVLKQKISALSNYKNELGEYPHPRSKQAIIARSNYWGASVGMKNAEAFIVIRDLIK